jgi:16S rRNA A1518/A1519 N6-dimethyltransferase RsmA/KsgA/DIM1 with predicted DNA glycosylase/AP lyase activity
VTFSSVVGSSSQKLCQSSGTIQIKMQKHQPAYVQIDNTPYKITSPQLVKIYKHGKIQVLINKESLMSQ